MSETAEKVLADVLAIALRAPRDLPASHPADYERDGRDLQSLLPRIVAALRPEDAAAVRARQVRMARAGALSEQQIESLKP